MKRNSGWSVVLGIVGCLWLAVNFSACSKSKSDSSGTGKVTFGVK